MQNPNSVFMFCFKQRFNLKWVPSPNGGAWSLKVRKNETDFKFKNEKKIICLTILYIQRFLIIQNPFMADFYNKYSSGMVTSTYTTGSIIMGIGCLRTFLTRGFTNTDAQANWSFNSKFLPFCNNVARSQSNSYVEDMYRVLSRIFRFSIFKRSPFFLNIYLYKNIHWHEGPQAAPT